MLAENSCVGKGNERIIFLPHIFTLLKGFVQPSNDLRPRRYLFKGANTAVFLVAIGKVFLSRMEATLAAIRLVSMPKKMQ